MSPSSFFQYPSKVDTTRRPSRSPSTSSPSSPHSHSRQIGSSSFTLTVPRPRIFNTRSRRYRSRSISSSPTSSQSLSSISQPTNNRPRRNITKEKMLFEAKSEMSATVAQMAAALKVDIKVIFDQAGKVVANQPGAVDMLGGASTGYSLPGHVIITIPALPAGQAGKLREIRELKLVVEGKSEFWDDNGRYNPVRLYTETIDLAEAKPLLIPSSDPLLPTCKQIELAVAFDLRLPGWLPPTHRAYLTNTEYGLVVQSTIGWTQAAASVYGQPKVGDKCVATRSLKRGAALLSHVENMEEKYTSPYQTFDIHRHRLPSALNHRAINATEKDFNLKPGPDSTSPIECIVTIPEWVDCYGQEKGLRIGIRVRARRAAILAQNKSDNESASPFFPGDWDDCGTAVGTPGSPSSDGGETPATTTSPTESVTRPGTPSPTSVPMTRNVAGDDEEILTRIIELGMEVEEIESYSSIVSPGFKAVFPIPEDNQPDRHSSQNAFISPRNPRADKECTVSSDPYGGYRTRKCLLAEDGSQRNFYFDGDGLAMNELWRKVNVVLPMPSGSKGLRTRPQSEMDGPMLRIKHALKIRMVCRNVGSSGEDMAVVLSVPIRFGTCPESVARTCLYRKPLLPAYIQLYHENGEQLPCDPLPIYQPLVSPSAPPPYSPPAAHLPIATMFTTGYASRSPSPQPSSTSRSSTPDSGIVALQPPVSDDGHSTSTGGTSRNPGRYLPPWANTPPAKCQAVPVVSAQA